MYPRWRGWDVLLLPAVLRSRCQDESSDMKKSIPMRDNGVLAPLCSWLSSCQVSLRKFSWKTISWPSPKYPWDNIKRSFRRTDSLDQFYTCKRAVFCNAIDFLLTSILNCDSLNAVFKLQFYQNDIFLL